MIRSILYLILTIFINNLLSSSNNSTPSSKTSLFSLSSNNSPCSPLCRQYSKQADQDFKHLAKQTKELEELRFFLEKDTASENLPLEDFHTAADSQTHLSQLTLARDTAQDAQSAHVSLQLTAHTILNWHTKLTNKLTKPVELCDEHSKLIQEIHKQVDTPQTIAQQALDKAHQYKYLEVHAQETQQDLDQFLKQTNMQSLDEVPQLQLPLEQLAKRKKRNQPTSSSNVMYSPQHEPTEHMKHLHQR